VALKEMCRVLKPNGKLLSWSFLKLLNRLKNLRLVFLPNFA